MVGVALHAAGVSSAIGDGRSTLAARDKRYDTVHIGFTNTLAASGSGSAYALSENHLYTVEAFDEYFDHLRPGGMPEHLAALPLHRRGGAAGDRADARGAARARRRRVRRVNVVVLLGKARERLLRDGARPSSNRSRRASSPWCAELAPVRDHALPGEDTGVVYAPGGPYKREWVGPAQASDLDSWCASYRSNVCAPTDDKPFFLNPTRLGDVFESAPPGATFLSRTPFFILLAVLGILLRAVAGGVRPAAVPWCGDPAAPAHRVARLLRVDRPRAS